MRCNQCHGPMVPDHSALVPAMACTVCGRLVPRTAAKGVRAKNRAADRAMVNRVARAARRQAMGREAA